MIDLSQVAILIGIANGAALLIKPIGRLHDRIDDLESRQHRLEGDVGRLIAALSPERR